MRFIAVFLSVFTLFCVAYAADPVATPPLAQSPATSPTATPAPIAASPEVAATPLPASTAASAFQNGIAAFQKNDFKLARSWFHETLAKDPSQIVAWYDLGLSEQNLGNAGLAIAFWRKALAISPTFSQAHYAIEYTRAKLEHSDIPHDVETWETLRSSVLVYLSAKQFAMITALLFFLGGWLLLMYVGSRRRAILDEKPLPGFPVPATLIAITTLIVLGLTVCKIVDNQDTRATVIAKKVEARALPDTTSTSLFDLYEGLEVIVRQVKAPWIQVTFPGGATGWIPRDSLFTMNDNLQTEGTP